MPNPQGLPLYRNSSAKWEKRGLTYCPAGEKAWMQTHASNPIAYRIAPDRLRLYFSSRDDSNRSHFTFVETTVDQPETVLHVADRPCLSPGPLGHFDDHGTYGMSLVECDGRLLLYYVGWNSGAGRLYYASIGLAESSDGGETFERTSSAPILARSHDDPWMVSSPYVLRESPTSWLMWYLSGIGWKESCGALHSYYHLKFAHSEDGIHWQRRNKIAIDLEPGDRNIARMCVVPHDGWYEGWYSYAGSDGYRIGYAESQDGASWEREDTATGIDLSASGWDSEAQAYPFLLDTGDRRLLFYSGNEVGKTGFGVAEEIIS